MVVLTTRGIFVLEALSVMAQVASFKLTGKRVLKMAPLHHHFELSGWTEVQTVQRFWLAGALAAGAEDDGMVEGGVAGGREHRDPVDDLGGADHDPLVA